MASRDRSGSSTPATTALDAADIGYVAHPYTHDPAAASYGEEAADALGFPRDRVFKTLVATVDGALTVAIVPVSGQLDLKALAKAVNGKRAAMADIAAAERTTGYVVGGVSPIGQRKALPTVVDESALTFDTILVSGGKRGLDIELAPDDLIAITSASVAPIGRT